MGALTIATFAGATLVLAIEETLGKKISTDKKNAQISFSKVIEVP